MISADSTIIDATGYLAAGIVFLTFCMKRMTALRITAVTSNIAFILYALTADLMPILILHGFLLPLNLWRLAQMRRDVSRASAAVAKGADVSDFGWLIPLGRKRRLESGARLFAKGEIGESLFIVMKGELSIEEVGIVLGPGAMLGEVSLFTNDSRRTATAVAVSDVDLSEITRRRVKELCFDSPEFAYNLIRLITQRLVTNVQKYEGPTPKSAAIEAYPAAALRKSRPEAVRQLDGGA